MIAVQNQSQKRFSGKEAVILITMATNLYRTCIEPVVSRHKSIPQGCPLSTGLNTERSYLTEAEVFSLSVTNLSFNMLFEISQICNRCGPVFVYFVNSMQLSRKLKRSC